MLSSRGGDFLYYTIERCLYLLTSNFPILNSGTHPSERVKQKQGRTQEGADEAKAPPPSPEIPRKKLFTYSNPEQVCSKKKEQFSCDGTEENTEAIDCADSNNNLNKLASCHYG